MARTNNLTNFLTDVAASIKEKKGYQSSQKIQAADFDTEIASIQTVHNQNKTVSPQTYAQEISADNGYTGLGTVTVNAVTSAIDNDIAAGNIKSGVEILGVTGTVVELVGETKTVTPTTSEQVITPSTGKNAITQVTVSAVDNTIDANIIQANIRAGVTILGVEGNLAPDKPDQTKTVTPTTSSQTIEPDTGYELASVTVNAVTSAIDNNIVAGNIKEGVTILGVTGTVHEGVDINNEDVTVTPTTSSQTIEASTGYTGLGTVIVNAVDNTIDANIVQANIKAGVTILGVTGNLEPDKPDQTKTCTPSTSQQVIEPDTGYELASVTVSAVTAAIDNNIIASNIAQGVTILGVTGTFDNGVAAALAGEY